MGGVDRWLLRMEHHSESQFRNAGRFLGPKALWADQETELDIFCFSLCLCPAAQRSRASALLLIRGPY